MIDLKLFGGFDNGQTDGQTDGRTDICSCRVAFATENRFNFGYYPRDQFQFCIILLHICK